jgi:hypothetical protein
MLKLIYWRVEINISLEITAISNGKTLAIFNQALS